jgi:hypothetical protein
MVVSILDQNLHAVLLYTPPEVSKNIPVVRGASRIDPFAVITAIALAPALNPGVPINSQGIGQNTLVETQKITTQETMTGTGSSVRQNIASVLRTGIPEIIARTLTWHKALNPEIKINTRLLKMRGGLI